MVAIIIGTCYCSSNKVETKNRLILFCLFWSILSQLVSETQTASGFEGQLSPEVSSLVDYIWAEANGQLEDTLSVPVSTLKVEAVDKGEAALLTIKRLLADTDMEKAKRGEWVCLSLCALLLQWGIK